MQGSQPLKDKQVTSLFLYKVICSKLQKRKFHVQKQDTTRTRVTQIQDKSYYLSLLPFSCYEDSTNSLILIN